ncbi:unnamed protein product, partial [Prorocentrum cordatum]
APRRGGAEGGLPREARGERPVEGRQGRQGRQGPGARRPDALRSEAVRPARPHVADQPGRSRGGSRARTHARGAGGGAQLGGGGRA